MSSEQLRQSQYQLCPRSDIAACPVETLYPSVPDAAWRVAPCSLHLSVLIPNPSAEYDRSYLFIFKLMVTYISITITKTIILNILHYHFSTTAIDIVVVVDTMILLESQINS